MTQTDTSPVQSASKLQNKVPMEDDIKPVGTHVSNGKAQKQANGAKSSHNGKASSSSLNANAPEKQNRDKEKSQKKRKDGAKSAGKTSEDDIVAHEKVPVPKNVPLSQETRDTIATNKTLLLSVISKNADAELASQLMQHLREKNMVAGYFRVLDELNGENSIHFKKHKNNKAHLNNQFEINDDFVQQLIKELLRAKTSVNISKKSVTSDEAPKRVSEQKETASKAKTMTQAPSRDNTQSSSTQSKDFPKSQKNPKSSIASSSKPASQRIESATPLDASHDTPPFKRRPQSASAGVKGKRFPLDGNRTSFNRKPQDNYQGAPERHQYANGAPHREGPNDERRQAQHRSPHQHQSQHSGPGPQKRRNSFRQQREEQGGAVHHQYDGPRRFHKGPPAGETSGTHRYPPQQQRNYNKRPYPEPADDRPAHTSVSKKTPDAATLTTSPRITAEVLPSSQDDASTSSPQTPEQTRDTTHHSTSDHKELEHDAETLSQQSAHSAPLSHNTQENATPTQSSYPTYAQGAFYPHHYVATAQGYHPTPYGAQFYPAPGAYPSAFSTPPHSGYAGGASAYSSSQHDDQHVAYRTGGTTYYHPNSPAPASTAAQSAPVYTSSSDVESIAGLQEKNKKLEDRVAQLEKKVQSMEYVLNREFRGFYFQIKEVREKLGLPHYEKQ